MKINLIEKTNSTHTYKVILQNDTELSWSDFRLITTVDRQGELSDEDWQKIVNKQQHPCHFGGVVKRGMEGECEVKVYVD